MFHAILYSIFTCETVMQIYSFSQDDVLFIVEIIIIIIIIFFFFTFFNSRSLKKKSKISIILQLTIFLLYLNCFYDDYLFAFSFNIRDIFFSKGKFRQLFFFSM